MWVETWNREITFDLQAW